MAFDGNRVLDMHERILALHTSQDIDKIEKDTDKDFFMNPQEAKEYA